MKPASRRLHRPAPLEEQEERRDHQRLDDPAEEHPARGDEAEVAERAEVGDEEREVRRGRGERRDDRRLPRRADRRAKRLGGGHAAPPLLEVPRLVEDADVDPVARDDADEKARGHVEVPDDELREAERPHEAHADGDPHHEERAQAHEVEEHRRQDERDAGRAHAEQVVPDPCRTR